MSENVNRKKHMEVARKRGKASEHMCVEGGDHPAYDWASIHDTDREDIQNYQPMCRLHHNRYDWTPERKATLVKRMKENPPRRDAVLSEETKRKISLAKTRRK